MAATERENTQVSDIRDARHEQTALRRYLGAIALYILRHPKEKHLMNKKQALVFRSRLLITDNPPRRKNSS